MKGIMQAIVDFFTLIVSIIEFLFKGIILMFTLLFQAVRILYEVVTFLPTPYLVSTVGLIAVCVIYKILGRENQS